MRFLTWLTRRRRSGKTKYVFFTGKGGVGKSTMSCATAVWLAKRGYKTLLVTTDPAPNLSDIFGQEIGAKVTQINGIRRLYSIEIDPDVATQEYKERTISPIRQIVSDEKQLQVIGEQLNSPCVDEVAAFDKFIEFMDDPQIRRGDIRHCPDGAHDQVARTTERVERRH